MAASKVITQATVNACGSAERTPRKTVVIVAEDTSSAS